MKITLAANFVSSSYELGLISGEKNNDLRNTQETDLGRVSDRSAAAQLFSFPRTLRSIGK